MGAGAVEGGEGLIEHGNDPLLLIQLWERNMLLKHLCVCYCGVACTRLEFLHRLKEFSSEKRVVQKSPIQFLFGT